MFSIIFTLFWLVANDGATSNHLTDHKPTGYLHANKSIGANLLQGHGEEGHGADTFRDFAKALAGRRGWGRRIGGQLVPGLFRQQQRGNTTAAGAIPFNKGYPMPSISNSGHNRDMKSLLNSGHIRRGRRGQLMSRLGGEPLETRVGGHAFATQAEGCRPSENMGGIGLGF